MPFMFSSLASAQSTETSSDSYSFLTDSSTVDPLVLQHIVQSYGDSLESLVRRFSDVEERLRASNNFPGYISDWVRIAVVDNEYLFQYMDLINHKVVSIDFSVNQLTIIVHEDLAFNQSYNSSVFCAVDFLRNGFDSSDYLWNVAREDFYSLHSPLLVENTAIVSFHAFTNGIYFLNEHLPVLEKRLLDQEKLLESLRPADSYRKNVFEEAKSKHRKP